MENAKEIKMENANEIDFGKVNKTLEAINDLDVTQCVRNAVNQQLDTLLTICQTFSAEIKKYKENNKIQVEKIRNCQIELDKEREDNKWSKDLLKTLSKGIADYINKFYKINKVYKINKFYKNNTQGFDISDIIEGLKKAFKDAGIDLIFYSPGQRIPEDAKMTVLQESQGVTKENENTVCECSHVTFMRGDEIIVEGKVYVYNSSSVNKVENSLNKSDLCQKSNNVHAAFRKNDIYVYPNTDEMKKLFYNSIGSGNVEYYLLNNKISLGITYHMNCLMKNPNGGNSLKITAYVFYIDGQQRLILRVWLEGGQEIELYYSYIDDAGKLY